MKKILIAFLIITASTAQAQVKNILFLGNSYTYGNDLPTMLKTLAESFNDTIDKDQNTPGGYQLVQHVTNSTTLSKIASRNWDHVIIQEQSQKPSFSPGQVATGVYPYAKTLCDSIRSNYSCTEPIFFMTWGRENGDASNCASYPPICTFNGMNQRLRESYTEMAVNNSCTVAPVGAAWKTVRDSFPTIQLYTSDGSHPNVYGTYLAACVFYATIYQKSPIGATYVPAGIGATDALNIQTTASNTVLDSMSIWQINANKPTANFNYSGSGTINFTNSSTNGATYAWDFGDGNSSTLEDPNHTYGSNNTYTVQLITFSTDSCFSDTITQSVNVTATGINNTNNINGLTIYPNPANDFIEIKTDLKYNNISIIDVTGKTIKQVNSNNKIDISNLTTGIYFIKIIGTENAIIKKFVKQ